MSHTNCLSQFRYNIFLCLYGTRLVSSHLHTVHKQVLSWQHFHVCVCVCVCACVRACVCVCVFVMYVFVRYLELWTITRKFVWWIWWIDTCSWQSTVLLVLELIKRNNSVMIYCVMCVVRLCGFIQKWFRICPFHHISGQKWILTGRLIACSNVFYHVVQMLWISNHDDVQNMLSSRKSRLPASDSWLPKFTPSMVQLSNQGSGQADFDKTVMNCHKSDGTLEQALG